MMNDLSNKLLNRIHTVLTGHSRLEKHTILGHELVLRRGAYRHQPDYDDAWLLACALRSKSVLDIGCNIGQASIIILLSPSVQRIVLVDPNPAALIVAADNIIRNQLANMASFVCAFVSDTQNSSQEFWTVGTGAAGSMFSAHAQTAARKKQQFKVNTDTVDNICNELCLEPDLIKVDVEGAEAKVLAGAEQIALNQRSRFLVEMHSSSDLPMVVNGELILEWCSRMGYSAWYLSKHSRLISAHEIAHRGRCHLLLQPENWSFPDWLLSVNQSDHISAVLL